MVKVGDSFDTAFEVGCYVRSTPDEGGNFLGLDSDQVEAWFNTKMITHTPSLMDQYPGMY